MKNNIGFVPSSNYISYANMVQKSEKSAYGWAESVRFDNFLDWRNFHVVGFIYGLGRRLIR